MYFNWYGCCFQNEILFIIIGNKIFKIIFFILRYIFFFGFLKNIIIKFPNKYNHHYYHFFKKIIIIQYLSFLI